LAQTVDDFEVIVIDDGSKDNTYLICAVYARKDCRIKLIRQENRGVACTRNRLLDMASGEWIVFVDSDDYIAEDYLEGFDKQISFEPRIDVVICNVYFVNKGKITAHPSFKGDKELYYHELLRKRYRNIFSSLCGKAIRRSFIEQHHIRCLEQFNLGEDSYFLIVMLYHTENISISNTPLYFHERHENSITHSCKYAKDMIECYHAILDFIHSKVDSEKYEDSLNQGKMRIRYRWYMSVRRREQRESCPYVFDDVQYAGLPALDKVRLFCITHDWFNAIRIVDRLANFFA